MNTPKTKPVVRRKRRSQKDESPLQQFANEYVKNNLAKGGEAYREGINDMLRDMSKFLIESMLKAEMEQHLDGNKPTDDGAESVEASSTKAGKNKRNGFSSKTVKSNFGPIELEIPRDRNSEFEPLIIPKNQRTFDRFNEQILAMYARGMSTRDISAFLQEQYGADVSAEYISRVTDSVIDDLNTWQNRPLETVYPVAFFDAMRVKVRSNGVVKSMAVNLAIGIRTDGTREVLGIWISENEGASFWAQVFNELRSRGVNDILIAVTDGLTGMTKAIETVFPRTLHQTCIVHLIRSSTTFVSYKDRKAVCDGLKAIYQAPNADAALEALEAFKESLMGQRYPVIAKSWERNWGQVIPFFQFPPEIRALIYTTNSIEALNRAVRKVIKTRAVFPNETAATKLIYMAIMRHTEAWKRPSTKWTAAMQQFLILFEDRFFQE